MIRFFQPTLTRRVVLAVLVSFALVWLALMSFVYVSARWAENHQNPALDQGAAAVLDALRGVGEPATAATIADAVERMMAGNRQRMHVPGMLVIQVWDRQTRRLVYSSPAMGEAPLKGQLTQQTDLVLRGRTYRVAERDSPRWTVVVGQTRLDRSWLLKGISEDLTKYMIIAFPFVLIPVWLAVARGLSPLRHLSRRIAARGPDDLTPIGLKPKYAELEPMVAALDDLLAKLNIAIGRERALVQDAAHELRTPLAVISVHAHALARAANEVDRSEAERGLDVALGRAGRLIHQLLALARLEIEHGSPLVDVDLADLLRQDLAGFSPAAMARNIEISLEGPDTLETRIDTLAFQAVVYNLLENAIRYGHRGGQIVVELHGGDHKITLTVADDGPGIPESDRAQVFNRFYRGSHHDLTGTGLGLAIVRQAAARLGGEVRLGIGLGGSGCRFTLVVPQSVTTWPPLDCGANSPH